jgi:hypothetical protein
MLPIDRRAYKGIIESISDRHIGFMGEEEI